MQMTQKRFHRHFATKGLSLYWIIIAYIIVGWFYPIIGLLALICMIGPVVTSVTKVLFSIWKGRWWCGNVCPRGNMYDRLLSKYSPHRPIPEFVRTFGFRLFMVLFIFSMFGIQLAFVESWSDVGRVFWRIIVMTTVVGVVLSFIYAPRTWCSFCPMGTISRWVAPKTAPVPSGFTNIHVSSACQMKCKSCARVCPMQLTPFDSRGQEAGYMHPDCIKCGKCTLACPTKIMTLRKP